MNIVLDMPTSELTFTPLDNQVGLAKLRKSLSFSIKHYNGREMTFEKVCLLNDTKFRTGLWKRIEMVGPILGLPIESIVDNRPAVRKAVQFGASITLRDYQEKSVQEMLEHDMGVMYAATGAGKTHMAAALIQRRGCRTLFLVHTKDLLHQAKERFEELLKVKVGIIGDGDYDLQDVTVATVQTLYRRIGEGVIDALKDSFDMIIQDETHHIPAATFYEVAGHFRARYVYGLSATPYRKDGSDLYIEAGAGPIVSRVSVSELIDQGVLSKPLYRFIPINGETSYSEAPRWAVIKKYVTNNEAFNKQIADLAKGCVKDGRTVLVAVSHVVHGNNIAKFLPEAQELYGQHNAATRSKVLKQFRDQKIKVLISTLLGEGVDVPSLDVVINCFGGTDPIQLVGRVLRKTATKNSALIIDFVQNTHVSLQRASFARMKRVKQEEGITVMVG